MKAKRLVITAVVATVTLLSSTISVEAKNNLYAPSLKVAIPSTGDGGLCGTSANWTLTSDGELTISGSGAMEDYSPASLPGWAIYKDSIKKVWMEGTVDTIGKYAFAGMKLENLSYGSKVDTVKDNAFKDTTVEALIVDEYDDLVEFFDISYGTNSNPVVDKMFIRGLLKKDVEVPVGITTIKSRAIANIKSIESITTSSAVFIADGAFEGAYASDVILNSGVKTIGNKGFDGMANGLRNLVVPATVKEVGKEAFDSVAFVYFAGSKPKMETNSLLGKENQVVFYPYGDSTWANVGQMAWHPISGNYDKYISVEGIWENADIVSILAGKTPTIKGFELVCKECGEHKQIMSESDIVNKTGPFITKATISADGTCRYVGMGKYYNRGEFKSGNDIVIPKPVKVTKSSSSNEATVLDAAGNTIPTDNYDVTYSNDTKTGSTTATVTFKGLYYEGSLSATYKTVSDDTSVDEPTVGKTSISKVTNTDKGIKVEWKKVSDAEGYYVYRAKDGGKYSKVATTDKLSYVDTKATVNGSKYSYKIVAYNDSVVSKASAVVSTYRLSSPVVNSISNKKAKTISVAYKKNASATGYQIQYGLKSDFSSSKTVKIAKNTVVSKDITKLTKGKTYYVRIRAYKTVDGKTVNSAWSVTKKIKVVK